MKLPANEMDESATEDVGSDVSPWPADCGMPVDGTFRRKLVTWKQASLSRRHRAACLGVDAVCYGMVSLVKSSRKLCRAMLS